jgi:hypothetical protein
VVNRQEAAKKLLRARKMKTRAAVESFDDARAALFATGDPAVLKDLFAAFDDSTEQHEVMWGLVHDVEGFGLEQYMKAMGEAAPKMLPRAKEWLTILHERILNSRKAIEVYRGIIPTLPERSQAAIKKLLEEMEQATPKLKGAIRRLLAEGKS